jgi:glycosyltransferase involved in cell wall biosynthesis
VCLAPVARQATEVLRSHSSPTKKQGEESGIADPVLFTGYLPQGDWVVLLNLITVLILPSLMEGLGLPAIGVAACGCPIIATTASLLLHLPGDRGLYVDPTKAEDLELALMRVLSSESLRHRMCATGLAAAGDLTWDAAAPRMIGLAQRVIAR